MTGSLNFINRHFTVLTALSACPLLCGNMGVLVTCLKPYDTENIAIHTRTVNYCQFLPMLKKAAFKDIITTLDVVDVSLVSSGFHKKLSATRS